jgi:hypothetical protein
MSQPNCHLCGKFVSWKDFVVCTPFGSVLDLEPPDDEYFHPKCYEGWIGKRLLDDPRYTWIPAQRVSR